LLKSSGKEARRRFFYSHFIRLQRDGKFITTILKRCFMGFREFNLDSRIIRAVEERGFKTPSPIQKEAIPIILEGGDLIAQAETGSGKTGAFGLPLLSKLKPGEQILVLTPTRELATQVADELYKFGKYKRIKTATIYGGVPYYRQIEGLKRRPVVVATPGRLLDLLQNKGVPFKPRFIVLDEADEMLNMGFLPDIKKILSLLPEPEQILLFSATMPPQIVELAKEFLDNPNYVRIAPKEKKIEEKFFLSREHQKPDYLYTLLQRKNPTKAIIFCQRKRDVDYIHSYLAEKGLPVERLHGDIPQNRRERIIRKFRKGEAKFLVATDVAARGLDIKEVSHIFNFHIPENRESYIHRIGRTGRAGEKGVAVSLVTRRELSRLKSWGRKGKISREGR
jgi:ATP-dependent RNA helicase DeaD